jgi:hypothetical protein
MFDFSCGKGAKGTSPSKFLRNTYTSLDSNAHVQAVVAKFNNGAKLEVVIENQDGVFIAQSNAGLVSKMIKINVIVGVIAGYFQSKGVVVKLAAKQSKWRFDKIHKDRKKNIITKALSILRTGLTGSANKTNKTASFPINDKQNKISKRRKKVSK